VGFWTEGSRQNCAARPILGRSEPRSCCKALPSPSESRFKWLACRPCRSASRLQSLCSFLGSTQSGLTATIMGGLRTGLPVAFLLTLVTDALNDWPWNCSLRCCESYPGSWVPSNLSKCPIWSFCSIRLIVCICSIPASGLEPCLSSQYQRLPWFCGMWLLILYSPVQLGLPCCSSTLDLWVFTRPWLRSWYLLRFWRYCQYQNDDNHILVLPLRHLHRVCLLNCTFQILSWG